MRPGRGSSRTPRRRVAPPHRCRSPTTRAGELPQPPPTTRARTPRCSGPLRSGPPRRRIWLSDIRRCLWTHVGRWIGVRSPQGPSCWSADTTGAGGACWSADTTGAGGGSSRGLSPRTRKGTTVTSANAGNTIVVNGNSSSTGSRRARRSRSRRRRRRSDVANRRTASELPGPLRSASDRTVLRECQSAPWAPSSARTSSRVLPRCSDAEASWIARGRCSCAPTSDRAPDVGVPAAIATASRSAQSGTPSGCLAGRREVGASAGDRPAGAEASNATRQGHLRGCNAAHHNTVRTTQNARRLTGEPAWSSRTTPVPPRGRAGTLPPPMSDPGGSRGAP